MSLIAKFAAKTLIDFIILCDVIVPFCCVVMSLLSIHFIPSSFPLKYRLNETHHQNKDAQLITDTTLRVSSVQNTNKTFLFSET